VVDAVVYAQSGTDRLAYDDAADVAVTGVAPDRAASVVFDAWKSTLAGHMVTATGAPEAGSFSHGATLVKDGVVVESLGYGNVDVAVPGDVVGGVVEFADQFYDRFIASIEYTRDSAPDSYGRLYLPGAQVGTNADPATTSVSLATDVPAPPTAVDLTSSITYTAPAWTCADDSAAPSATVAVRFRESGGKGGPGDIVFHQWYLVAAGDVASGTAWPELDPAAVAELWPGDFIGGQDSIRFITDDGADWDAMRGELDFLAFGNLLHAPAGIRCVGGIEYGIAPSAAPVRW
jgi:hypothetical protein